MGVSRTTHESELAYFFRVLILVNEEINLEEEEERGPSMINITSMKRSSYTDLSNHWHGAPVFYCGKTVHGRVMVPCYPATVTR